MSPLDENLSTPHSTMRRGIPLRNDKVERLRLNFLQKPPIPIRQEAKVVTHDSPKSIQHGGW
jgi:hypothetical protein